MKTAPGFLGSLFGGSRGGELAFGAESLTHSKAGHTVSQIPLEAITVATADAGMIWSKITVSTSHQRVVLNGVGNKRASQFVEALRGAIRQAMLRAITRHKPKLQQIAEGMHGLLSGPRYVSHRDVECWKSKIADTDQALLTRIFQSFADSSFPREDLSGEIRANLELLSDVMSGPRDRVIRGSFCAEEPEPDT
jgi:hypothetical protein